MVNGLIKACDVSLMQGIDREILGAGLALRMRGLTNGRPYQVSRVYQEHNTKLPECAQRALPS